MAKKKNNTGKENTGDGNSGDRNSGYRNSGDGNSGDGNSGDGNSGDRNSGYGNSGYGNSGNRNSGNRNSGDWNSGYGNSGNRETGIFNTEESTIRCFNKDSGKKFSEIAHPHFIEFYLTKWIPEDDMTDKEKKSDPEFYVRGGYLRKYTYKEAWRNFWKDTDKKNRERFLSLPNFDANIFEEITGIKVNESTKKQELLDKADELIKKANELKDKAENI